MFLTYMIKILKKLNILSGEGIFIDRIKCQINWVV